MWSSDTPSLRTVLAFGVGVACAIFALALLAGDVRAQSAADKLSELTVRQERSLGGYDREDYPHWSDAQRFGWKIPPGTPDPQSCDTREAALIRDGTNERVTGGCEVTSGRWLDPYTGQVYTRPSDLDADHIVPLAESYASGSAGWSAARKERFANSPMEVMMVDDSANASKSDSDPAQWRPPRKAYHCTYARKWISIKSAWDLSVDPAEKRALRQMLGSCSTGSSGGPGAVEGDSQRKSEGGPGAGEGDSHRKNELLEAGGDLPLLPDTGGPALAPVVGVVLLAAGSLLAGRRP